MQQHNFFQVRHPRFVQYNLQYKLQYIIQSYTTLYFITLCYNSSYIIRPNFIAIFRVIFKRVLCTVDNAFNLQDIVLQELVKINFVFNN